MPAACVVAVGPPGVAIHADAGPPAVAPAIAAVEVAAAAAVPPLPGRQPAVQPVVEVPVAAAAGRRSHRARRPVQSQGHLHLPFPLVRAAGHPGVVTIRHPAEPAAARDPVAPAPAYASSPVAVPSSYFLPALRSPSQEGEAPSLAQAASATAF
eukprot:scaffold11693_cov115-Isochrysis_galbana.AAC.6